MDEQIDQHIRTVETLRRDIPLLEKMADRIIEAFRGSGRVYVLGNGGSAADAQHIATELLGRFKRDRRALPAMALTTDSSMLTAIANDLGFETMFARQVEGLATANDIVWALSVSGGSSNVLAAVSAARRQGATVLGFTSRRGSALAELCDLCLMVDHEASDRVQEAHELAYHLVCNRVEQAFA
ncbi:MAG: SIS domain-containing protein [Planctomycetes bacterium]|nr:SIS domain-containing protein [Planctomycetota bacterium]